MSENTFPFIDNVNVAKTETKFNYALWGAETEIKVCNVNWSSDYSDVVKFNTDTERNEYFKSLTGHVASLNTQFRVAPNGDVKLPIPFDDIIDFNYLVATYPLSPVPGVTANARLKYFYFVKEIKFISPNTSLLVLQLDVWTTFINDININNLTLERGHGPMSKKTVAEYLSSPMANCENLLTPDINFGRISNVKYEKYVPFHKGDQYVLIATSSDPSKDWTNKTTTSNPKINDGLPNNINIFAVKASEYIAFASNIESNIPQFVQTIQSVYFLDESFITLESSFVFGAITCYNVSKRNNVLENLSLDESMFGYDDKYKWITKLYTSPYSVLEITDNNGKSSEIAIEDISSSIGVRSMSSIAFPYLNIRAFVTGIGGEGSNSYAIKAFNSDSTVDMYKDNWQQYSWEMDIPTYGIFQNARNNYEFNSHFNRIQQQNDIDISYENNNRSNATASGNSSRSNNNSSVITKRGNDLAILMADYNKTYSTDQTENNKNRATANTTETKDNNEKTNFNSDLAIDAINELGIFTGTMQQMSGVGLSAIGGVVSGNPVGAAVSAAVGAAGSIIGTGLGATGSPVYKAINDVNYKRVNMYITNITDINNSYATISNELSNNKITHDSALEYDNAELNRQSNYSVNDSNRAASLSTSNANNAASKSNSEIGIQNSINQSGLNNNIQFGQYGGNGHLDAQGLRGLDIKIKTQSKDAIAKAGDAFLRFGYMFDGNFDFTNFNIMQHFTFWKAKEVWLTSQKVNEGARNIIRNILYTGVTVWRNPIDIGTIQIYENTI